MNHCANGEDCKQQCTHGQTLRGIQFHTVGVGPKVGSIVVILKDVC